VNTMPWKPGDAAGHTHKANTPKRQRQWRDVANSALKRGASDASAIKQANAVVARSSHPSQHAKRGK
jgi:hypothetical protein